MKFLVRHFSAYTSGCIMRQPGTKPGGELSPRRNNGNHRPEFRDQANESAGSLSQECKKSSFRSFIRSRRAGIRRDSLPERAAHSTALFSPAFN